MVDQRPLQGMQAGAPASSDGGVHGPCRFDSEGRGALELFIRDFNAFEAEAGLFSRCRDREGFPWWDLVRYSIQYQLCAEKGIYAPVQAQRRRLIFRAASFASQSASLLAGLFKVLLMRGRGIEHLYVFGRRSAHLVANIHSNCATYLLITDGSPFPHSRPVLHKRTIDFFVRLRSRTLGVPEDVTQEAARLHIQIQGRFGSDLDIRKLILTKYRLHLAASTAWSFILARVPNLKCVTFIGDDTLKTLVHLANSRSIETREFQHGYMGKSHVNYSYPDLTFKISTLPREVVVHRDSGDIVYPVRLQRSVSAERRDVVPGAPDRRDIDVLVGGSPTRRSEMLSIIEALVDRGLVVAVKLHPAQTEASSGIPERFDSSQVQVYSKEVDFAYLASRTHVYVPANPSSTTSFEAVEQGAKLVVVNYNGMKMTSMLDGIVSESVNAFQELHTAVLRYVKDAAHTKATPGAELAFSAR